MRDLKQRYSIDNTPPRGEWLYPVTFIAGMMFAELLRAFFMGGW